MNDVKSLSHSKWRCKYHIVFAPKYRRQIIYEQIKEDIGKILRSLCNRKQVELIEGEYCPDHIHILVAIPPHLSVSQFMGYLKIKYRSVGVSEDISTFKRVSAQCAL